MEELRGGAILFYHGWAMGVSCNCPHRVIIGLIPHDMYSLQVSNALYLVSLYAFKKCDKYILEDCYLIGLFENGTTDNIPALLGE